MSLEPGQSCLVQSQATLAVAGNTLSAATEAIVGGGLADLSNGAIPYNWPQLGGSTVRVGIAGIFTVVTNPITIRLRLGGAPTPDRNIPAGTIVHSFVLPVGASQVVDQISLPASIPGAISYLQATALSAGSAVLSVARLTLFAVPTSIMQALLLPTAQTFSHSAGSEIVRGQWWVNFDRFDAAQVKYALAGRSFQAVGPTARYKVRQGGTFGAADGTAVLSYDRSGDTSGDGKLSGANATVSRPSGVQLVKVTVQSLDGFPVSMNGCGLLLKGV